jgi:hypothetical protein
MPYKLRKAPKRDLYWVVNVDSGKKHSIEPIPRERAQRQMNLLRGVEHGFVPTKNYVRGGYESDSSSSSSSSSCSSSSSSSGEMMGGTRWIQKVVQSPKFKRGSFTKQALRHHETPEQFAHDVEKHPEEFKLTTRRRAQFLTNIKRR